MKMRLFSLVWGEPYSTWFEQALVASLLWPKNIEAIRAHATEINIYTRDQDRERLRSIAEELGVPLQFHPFEFRQSSGETLQPALLDHMRNCQQTGVAMFMAPPDTIFADGAIPAICEVGQARDVCVAVPHVRVNAGSWPPPGGKPFSPAQLVDHAFRNLHPTWRDADARLKNTNSRLGGVSWKPIGPSIYAVTHRLPTTYLANLNASDIEWFSRQFETGTYDHTWPAKLVKDQRQRVIASSDAAFIVELTRENENIPPVEMADQSEPDKFWRDLEHNYVNRAVVTIFRGEGTN